MRTVIWVKPNGNEIKINDDKANEAKARELGWKKKTGRKNDDSK